MLATAGAICAVAVAAAHISSGRYAGATTQTGQPNGKVKFAVVSNGTVVRGFSATVSAICTKHGATQPTLRINLLPTLDIPISSAGRFSFNHVFNINVNGLVIAKHVDGRIKGSFAQPAMASGTMTFAWTFDAAASKVRAGLAGQHCVTGTVAYTATHR